MSLSRLQASDHNDALKGKPLEPLSRGPARRIIIILLRTDDEDVDGWHRASRVHIINICRRRSESLTLLLSAPQWSLIL